MLDGRHTGTGGGNHVTLGGATPGGQPAAAPAGPAAEPDHVLAEPSGAVLPVFGHVHRPDQPGAARRRGARRPPVRAGDRLPADGDARARPARKATQPWLVDRLLRHLLTDLTGNTHRAEFSIDKLYSPDGPTGRLGLLEFRAFEMPPHWRMSALQMLLLRALVARFWRSPTGARWSAGAPRCTTAGCCRISSPPTSTTSSRTSHARGYAFERRGSRRSSSSAFRASAP